MKILSAEQIRAWDKYTIENEPITSIDLMERASKAFVDAFVKRIKSDKSVKVFCGPGNNGGDGLAIARLLWQKGYQVFPYFVQISKNTSADFKENHDRLTNIREVVTISRADELPEIKENDVVVDALFGSGLSRPAEGLAAEVINHINKAGAFVVAVDIPSGLYCDQRNDDPNIIRASQTITFQVPKFTFLLPENEKYIGGFEVVDIGLMSDYLREVNTTNYYLDEATIKSELKPRTKFSHKGTYGHALIVSGSYGKMGATVLCARACLRTGVGLVSVLIPKCGYEVLQASVPEAMVYTGDDERHLSGSIDVAKFDVLGIGPGIGQEKDTEQLLSNILAEGKPMVIDADTLNIISNKKDLLKSIPEGSVLTPHPKEFERLAGKWENDEEKLQKAKQLAERLKCIVLIKGAHTVIIDPNANCYFNATGNPGMATAGSGDVLTGIITALMAQGYTALQAATIGVYLHGYAGDCALNKIGEASIMASDIIENIGDFFVHFHSQ